MKTCNTCKIDKNFAEFNKRKDSKDGYTNRCKSCSANYFLTYKKNNLTKINKYQEKYRLEHQERISENNKKYTLKNKDKKTKYYKSYFQINKDRICEYRKNKRKSDIQYKISGNLRGRLVTAIKNGYKLGSAVLDLGCSIPFFKTYIEGLFKDGMSWDNWGRDTWHLDHKIPLKEFNLTNRGEFLKAVHYTNLQPMWAKENLSKGGRLCG